MTAQNSFLGGFWDASQCGAIGFQKIEFFLVTGPPFKIGVFFIFFGPTGPSRNLCPVGIYVLPIDVLLTFAVSTSSKEETLVVDYQFEF